MYQVKSFIGNYGSISDTLQAITYTAFNMADSVSENPYSLKFVYGPDNQRVKSVLRDSGNVFKTKYYSPGYEKEITPTGTRELTYINSPYGLVAIVIKKGDSDSTFYTETDHLGSIIGLIKEDTTYREHYSFDAWGRRRNPSNWTYDSIPAPTVIDRGFTGHEHLDLFGLINMNGRMYDPVVGRFLGVDPVIQFRDNSESFNGYSYCMNNPLRYSDPSGFSAYKDPWTDASWFHQSLADMQAEQYGDQGNDIENQREIDNQSIGGSGGPTDKIILISIPGIPGLVPISSKLIEVAMLNSVDLSAEIAFPEIASWLEITATNALGFVSLMFTVSSDTRSYDNPVFGHPDTWRNEVGTAFNHISPQPDNQNDFYDPNSNPGPLLKWGIAGAIAYDLLKEWHESTRPEDIAPVINKNKNDQTETIFIPYRPGYIPNNH
jgi:RHS repeat-associated protein